MEYKSSSYQKDELPGEQLLHKGDYSGLLLHNRVKPKIQRVQPTLKGHKAYQGCFEPSIVALGPFYHGKPRYQQMEEFKPKMANLFVKENGIPDARTLYDKVVAVLDEARSCYDASEISELSDSDFSKMMFLDGIFILQFLSEIRLDQPQKVPILTVHEIAHASSDLFLFENQIPFVVLDALMSSSSKDDKRPDVFTLLLDIPLPLDTMCSMDKRREMLNLTSKEAEHKLREYRSYRPVHLLDLARYLLVPETKKYEGQMSANIEGLFYISANDLKTNGINIRWSDSQHFTDIYFESNILSGTLWIPPVKIDYFAKILLLNMIAYEASSGGPADSAVTSYTSFMCSLICKNEDIQVLRVEGILRSTFGTDRGVAEFFAEIASSLVPNPNAYSLVKKQIEKHYRNKLKMWVTQCHHTFLSPESAPWTVIGLLLAMSIISLAFTQGWFAASSRRK